MSVRNSGSNDRPLIVRVWTVTERTKRFNNTHFENKRVAIKQVWADKETFQSFFKFTNYISFDKLTNSGPNGD